MISLIQHANNSTAASQNTIAVTISPSAKGSLIVVGYAGTCHLGGANTNTVTGVSDGTNTYIQVPALALTGTTSRNTTDVWYAVNSVAGITTVTVTVQATDVSEKNAEIWEVAGMGNLKPMVDVVSTTQNDVSTATTTPSGPSNTTTNSDDFIVANYIDDTNSVTVNPTAGNAFNAGGDISSVSNSGHVSAIVTSKATYTPNWTVGASGGTHVSSCVSFQPVSQQSNNYLGFKVGDGMSVSEKIK